MKEIIVVENKAFLNKTDFVCIEDIVKDLKVEYTKEQVPETMTELGKIASDLAIEKRCAMRYIDDSDGSFFIIKDSEMYLFKETRELTVSRLYHKLIWLLGE